MIAIDVAPGKYVVAVSGGVDSMVLLHLLHQQPGLELVVAHFEHGIRPDSDEDRQFVADMAEAYGLPYLYEHGNLGAGASEELARDARYAFLRRVMTETAARAIMTAHHQDDVLETAILNLLRGTGRKGLASLRSTAGLWRPLLDIPKAALLDYARHYQLAWREDSTNSDDTYMRNYVRHQLLPRMGAGGRQKMLQHIRQAGELNPKIDAQLLAVLPDHTIDRQWFATLPHDISTECLAAWLRQSGIRQFDRTMIERLVIAAKVAEAGKQYDINAEYCLKVSRDRLEIIDCPPRQKR